MGLPKHVENRDVQAIVIVRYCKGDKIVVTAVGKGDIRLAAAAILETSKLICNEQTKEATAIA